MICLISLQLESILNDKNKILTSKYDNKIKVIEGDDE